MRLWQASIPGFIACLTGGCASVTEGTTEPIYVTTSPEPGANCEVSNGRGSWLVTTPGVVVIKKSDSVLTVHCTKDGRHDAKEYYAAKLPTAALVGAFIPYVGLVSAAVDGSSGASGEYPNTITITMQKSDISHEAAPVANVKSLAAETTSGEIP